MTRLLYILRGMVPPRPDTERNQFTYLSQIADGEVLLPVWWHSRDEADPHLRATFPKYRVGNFCYHQFLDFRYPRGLRLVARFIFYISSGLQLHREKKFDVIMSYGTNLTGIAAVILKWLTGAKLLVALPNVPENAYRYYMPNEGFAAIIKRFIANLSLHFVCSAADLIDAINQLRNARLSHAFHLLIVGEGPQRNAIQRKIDQFGLREIVTLTGQQHNMRPYYTMADIVVLPSHSEGSPNVLLEAMAAGIPTVATNVGGIPEIATHGRTTLIVESKKPAAMAEALFCLIKDERLCGQLGEESVLCAAQYGLEHYCNFMIKVHRRVLQDAR